MEMEIGIQFVLFDSSNNGNRNSHEINFIFGLTLVQGS